MTNTIIFGAGMGGQSAYTRLKDTHKIIGFADNNPALHGQTLLALPIYSAQQLKGLAADTQILIASEFSEQISKQLADLQLCTPFRTLPAHMIKPIHFSDSPDLKFKAKKVLKQISRILTNSKIRHYIDAGTLLGIYRDRELIAWDDDLDFAVHSDDCFSCRKILENYLPTLQRLSGKTWSLETIKNANAWGAVPEGAIRALKLKCDSPESGYPMIDFFIKYNHGPWMDYCLASRGIRMPSLHFKGLSQFDFEDMTLTLPGEVEQYLQSHYGDWRTPKKDWSLTELTNATVF